MLPVTRKIKVLDLGCGNKPYKKLFSKNVQLIGFDIKDGPEVDVVGANWNLPFKDNEFDALICTQVLEHTMKVPKTISQIRRVVKPDGLVFISVPLTYPEHGAPHDYFRFTKYGLRYLFRRFKIILLLPHNGYLSTVIRLINTLLAYFPFGKHIFIPFYIFSNSFAEVLDFTARLIGSLPIPILKKLYQGSYLSLTESYSMIVQNNKY